MDQKFQQGWKTEIIVFRRNVFFSSFGHFAKVQLFDIQYNKELLFWSNSKPFNVITLKLND